MTERQLARRIVHWKLRMNLAHLRTPIDFGDELQGGPGVKARCQPYTNHDTMPIIFRTDILDEDDLEIDETIVHELLHFLFRDIDAAEHSICDHLTDAVHSVWDDRIDHAHEVAIERLARIIVATDTP